MTYFQWHVFDLIFLFFFISGPKVSQLNVEQFTREYIVARRNRVCNPAVGSTSTYDRRSSASSGSDGEVPTSAELVSKLFVT